jgi:hypothetical protein
MTSRESDPARPVMNCRRAASLLPFFACEELDPQEREQLAAHLATCGRCTAQLQEERDLLDAVAAAPQSADRLDPSDILLAQCRSELAESLDDLAAPQVRTRWQPFAWLRRLIIVHPAWSAAFLVLLGIFVGARASLFHAVGENSTSGRIVRASPPLTDDQLAKMAVAGINFSPSSEAEPGTIQVQLRAEQPYILTGNLDDTGMRRVLTYVVENGQRFDAGVRLDCLDALKLATKDTDVRRALLAAARRDANPAVRLKALDALRDAAEEADVRDAYLDALEHDANPGIRVEAVNLLVGSLQLEGADSVLVLTTSPNVPPAPPAPSVNPPAPDSAALARILRTLENMTRKDPNRYVRLRSAAALRQIGPREVH